MVSPGAKLVVSESAPDALDKAVALVITPGAVVTAVPAAVVAPVTGALKPSAARAPEGELETETPPLASSFNVTTPPLIVDGVPVPLIASIFDNTVWTLSVTLT